MGMFDFLKKKEANNSCCCGGSAVKEEKVVSCCCNEYSNNGEQLGDICCIKVLGAGCKSCHDMFENTKKATVALGLNVEVEYITDMEKVMSYGVMSMPVLVVNEKIVCVGKVLKQSEIEALLKK